MRRGLMGTAAIIAIAFAANACALWAEKDPVAGHWEGSWYLNKIAKPGGALRCDVTRVSKAQWKADFDAEFGGRANYSVELLGERKGEVVVFGGDVDLGAASGGVFKWTGEADGEKFTGKYSSTLYGGTFEMKRAPKPAATPAPAPAATP